MGGRLNVFFAFRSRERTADIRVFVYSLASLKSIETGAEGTVTFRRQGKVSAR